MSPMVMWSTPTEAKKNGLLGDMVDPTQLHTFCRTRKAAKLSREPRAFDASPERSERRRSAEIQWIWIKNASDLNPNGRIHFWVQLFGYESKLVQALDG